MADPTLDYLFNHIFLPSRLPHANDQGTGSGDRALADLVSQSASDFRELNGTQHYQEWSSLIRTLRTFSTLHRHNGSLAKDAIRGAIRDIRDGGILLFHILVQNSGLIVRKQADDYLIESFEASPPAATVLSACRALQWDFPSRAVAIPTPTFEEPSFQASFTEFLEKASVETVKQFAATTLKAGSLAYESRDTTTPSVIGQLFMSLLEANGHKHAPMLTRKRVHDEVCWNDGAETPWRRSANWLVLRVGLQRSLCFLLGGMLGTIHYKFFMCSVMASVCRKLCAATTECPDRLAFARSKLARRLAKLEQRRTIATPRMVEVINMMFSRHEKGFESAMRLANDKLQNLWSLIRARTTKRVLPLPRRADPASTSLSLYHSRSFLQRILKEALYGRPPVPLCLEQRLRNGLDFSTKIEGHHAQSATDYLILADFEIDLKRKLKQYVEYGPQEDLSEICMDLKHVLRQYQHAALPAYRSNPEQMSLALITIMELWQGLDSTATKLFPLLAKYNPGFPCDLLFFLQVSQLEDLQRLQKVEDYLDNRRNGADLSLPPIFGDIMRNSFAVRFFNQSHMMQDLMATIEHADETARIRKEAEWRQKSVEYEELLRQSAATACLFIEDEIDPLRRQHDDRRCRKHYLDRQARRMRIQIHEAMLPNEDFIAKAVIFELLLPQGFGAWRDVTWQMHNLARQDLVSDRAPQVLLQGYPSLSAYLKPTSCNITIASRTKSFQNTHYAQVPFPTSIDQVCLPHGLKYGLYDRDTGLWTSRHSSPVSFADLCAPCMPPKSAYGSLRKYLHPSFEGTTVSGNEVIASQTRCPNTLSVNEFMSFQGLRLGHGTQWVTLLRELASSNLNFGTVEVSTLVRELALLTGPSEGRSPLRANHWVFQDPEFCSNLAAQIRQRLDSIAANWREGQTVECMTTLIERIWSLAASLKSVKEAETLLLSVRKMTLEWTRLLRDEICNASDIETAQKRAQDVLLAAMLSRRTFMIDAAKPDQLIQPDALACFLECGFILKDNLPKNESKNVGKISAIVKKLFVDDLKLVHRLEDQLRRSIDAFPKSVGHAVDRVWAQVGGGPSRQYSTWSFLSGPYTGWMTAKSVSQGGLLEQSIHLDLLEGTLLIDSRPLGRLPEEYTKQEFFQQLFGNRVFLTRPSSLPGMSYMLASLFQGHEIHFGFREDDPFMRARTAGKILEMIPRTIFLSSVGGDAPDLPMPLINDCVHWLDLGSQVLEVRPYASMWQDKYSNWRIDLYSNVALRRSSLLVDPRSSIFNRVATLIEPFEQRGNMTVFQPEKGNLTLHLPALELQFRVNREGLLESPQLRAAVDLDQDAGTLYGLRSCLVLRDCVVSEDRSIIVAMGPANLTSKSVSNHVNVQINHTGYYARFFINKELGRLECAAEPRLVYFKAYCHAVTAFVLPDPLTGRTGTDEAIHCLQAANAQPWAPIDGESYRILSSIAKLTPQRLYYPEKLKALQKVVWDEALMPTVQHDLFRSTAREIVHQCWLLHRFHIGSEAPCEVGVESDEYLLSRAIARNRLHRASQHRAVTLTDADQVYVPRDIAKSVGSRNSYEAASLLKRWSASVDVSHDLAAVLREWPTIQGFDNNFELYLLADLINVDLASHWGSLVKLCLGSSEADKLKLMFVFATIAFNVRTDMAVIRSLIAIAIMEDFKNLHLPHSLVFKHFQGVQAPTTGFLVQLMKPYSIPYPEDERSLLSVAMHPKQRRKLEMAQLKHEEQADDSCKALATHLLSQWPCREPSVTGFGDFPLLDSVKASRAIQLEWERLFDNHQLSEHLSCVQKILNTCNDCQTLPLLPDSEGEQEFFSTPIISNAPVTLRVLLQEQLTHGSLTRHMYSDHPSMLSPTALFVELSIKVQSIGKIPLPTNNRPQLQSERRGLTPISELKAIVSSFANCNESIRRAYGRDLQGSITALEQLRESSPDSMFHSNDQLDLAGLNAMISSYRAVVQEQFRSICDTLIKHDHALKIGRLLRDITPVTLLGVLPTLKGNSAGFVAVIQYAQMITHLQRLLRIRSAHLRQDSIQLASELGHDGFENWHAKDHIDWLLLQIDFNLLIRQDQYEVAQAMISPRSGSNSVLQMNMGQGKSSVIIPMIVAKLANGKNLVRVVVPRPLLLQTAQLLQNRLGGFVGRTVKHIPFSRKSSTDMGSLKAYHSLHTKTLQNRGVILTLPEHILSFQLSGLQELSNGRLQQADLMLKLQNWLKGKSRDILDESDHMLAVKTQLIYPFGSQSMVDGHPSRWTTVQDLLKLVKIHLGQLRRRYPQGIEVIERGSGTFPTIFLLNQEVKNSLMALLTDSIISGAEGVLPIDGCSQDELMIISKFLREATFPKAVASKVVTIFKDKFDARQRLLLLRGLLVHRILLIGLSKRWNVQYGIDSRRDPKAVPFRSKGIPSDQAEFGHPDVSIMLTCLSFYYSGLTLLQFQQTLSQLLKSDEPVREYDSWMQGVQYIPDSLRCWNSINVEDETQCMQLWTRLCRQMAVINFFLNHFVFPRHARTFERKLVSSGWDIAVQGFSSSIRPLESRKENVRSGSDITKPRLAARTSLTVGFSGTNDNKTLLPMNVLQDDLPGLSHTNAEVLTYLLQPRNKRYYPALDARGRRLTERTFLQTLCHHKIRMLLDAGAQIIELDNISLARTWLSVDNEAEAAVFFGEDGRARILYRDGKQQPLAGSPFFNNLESCLVYLDEVCSLESCYLGEEMRAIA